MRKTYDYQKRENNNTWLLKHIKVLLEEANKHQNISFILYAAFEARNLLEKTEFDLILMSQNSNKVKKLIDIAKGKNGLRRTNEKYKTLKFKYQSFNEALCSVIIDDVQVKVFDYKKSGSLQSDLGEYLHVYTLQDKDYNYNSSFFQSGIDLIKQTIEFIKSYYTKTDDGYIFGIIQYDTIHGKIKDCFEKWRKSPSQETKSLYDELLKINKEEFNGEKLKIINN